MPAGRIAASLPLLALLAAAPTPDDVQQADQARAAALAAQQDAQARSLAAAAEAQRLADQRVTEAAQLLATERALDAAQQQVDALARRRDTAASQLAADSRALAPLLPLLERLSLHPAETLLALPGSPEDAVRGILLLGSLTRQLHDRAARVSAEQTQVQALQNQLAAALAGMQANKVAQEAQGAALDAALAQARAADGAAELQGEIAARRAETDAARTESLRQAIAALEAAARRRARALARQQAQAAAAAAAAPPTAPEKTVVPAALPLPSTGGWQVPAAGRVVRRFGAPGDTGPASGITLRTPGNARVVAPCGGRVEFASPFRSYGLLVIVSCGGGMHAVLSGLQRLDAAAGQAVSLGEPIGVMAPDSGTLYLELRRGGDPVDPAGYLRLAS